MRDEALIGPDLGEGKKTEDRASAQNAQLSVVWTLAYYVLLVVGAVSWYKFLWPMTESSSALARFSKPG